MRLLILRWLRLPCGACGGEISWCAKPFGHSDSCYYDATTDPLEPLRRKGRGWA